jgi:hypothetical protein
VTSAALPGPRVLQPAKITSAMPVPRRCLARCSPRHQRIASTMLDLPQPLGPMIDVTWSSTCTTSRSANDLKPLISIFLMRIAWPGLMSPGPR